MDASFNSVLLKDGVQRAENDLPSVTEYEAYINSTLKFESKKIAKDTEFKVVLEPCKENSMVDLKVNFL